MPIYSLGDSKPVLPDNGKYWIAPDAQVIGKVTLLENASLWFGVVARGDMDRLTIGKNSNIQDGTVLHSDAGFPMTVGNGVTVGHKAMLHGCTIGDNSLIGIGSTILNGAVIGKNCLIGAHALITEGKQIPDNSMVVGAPGRIIRKIDDEMAKMLKASADHYVENWQNYQKNLRQL
ncbi:MAG: gamma carbonic anhydrase family protein [Robiginitomaculum sp.]|nr:gamma carbonic anhydrase family protein [Robiginitomaculum sp.]MBL4618231.1 gamma carbonic anhydrase family protein [Robiginitomaculum sp.]